MSPTNVNPFLRSSSSLIGVLNRLRDLHPDMTVLQAQTFFAIAQNPGCSQRLLTDLLGTLDSVVARNIAILSDIGGRRVRALNLVRMDVNPEDRRERLCYLTRKGEQLMQDIMRDLRSTA